MFRLDSIEGNTQRLDGGAMYGNCPRAVWQKWSEPDNRNRILLSCRGLLIRDGSRTVLLETGIGAFFEPKLRDRFGVVEKDHVLLASLAALDVRPADIDVVVLSHLHFDHAGGMLTPWCDDEPELVFPNARFLVGKSAWERANNPHFRDRASFIPALNELLVESGRLELIEGETCSTLPTDTYSFRYSDGHTPGLMMTRVRTPRGLLTFVGDLMPGAPWVHLPITMGYDRYPELVIDEKKAMLEQVMDESGWLFFTHDPDVAACRVHRNDNGKFEAFDKQATVTWID